jgi:hypothetical protein
MPVPDFSPGEVLTAAAMDSIGLWLVKTVTIGVGATTVPVTNCFSSDYNNYRIVINGGTATSNGSLLVQLNGATGTTYQHFGYYGSFGVNSLIPYAPPLGTSWTDALISSTVGYGGTVDIFGPNLAQPTYATAWSTSGATAYNFALQETSSAQHTGFTLAPLNVGVTLTGGTIRVYGYRN